MIIKKCLAILSPTKLPVTKQAAYVNVLFTNFNLSIDSNCGPEWNMFSRHAVYFIQKCYKRNKHYK